MRLINKTKPHRGKVSKKILESVVEKLRIKTKFNQWKNSDSVIEWFKPLNDKKKGKFIVFDIVEFYPSITKDLFLKAVNWAASIVPISKQDKDVIFSSKKSLLFHRGQAWQKRGDSNFDVTMGSYDGAETADLV